MQEQVRRVMEVCLDSVESAVNAQKGGADRVELCAGLFEGGTTPSRGMIRQARRAIDILLNVIVRPRGGDFLYSEAEYRIMLDDIETAKDEGADGVVLGILTADGRVDFERTAALVEAAAPLPVTFHRAFDVTADPWQALEDVIAAGCRRVLTSGQEENAWEGIGLIAKLVERAGDRIVIMPGGGITERNIGRIAEASGAAEFHLYAHSFSSGRMKYRPGHVYMGGALRLPEYGSGCTDPGRIRGIRNILGR